MRLFYLVLAVAAALLVGVLFAPLLVEDPGYILVRFQGWAIETSVVVVVVGLIVLWAVLRLVSWFISLPRKGISGIKQRRVRRNVENSLLAISEGRWDRAERALVKSARGSEHPALNYLAAARAASDTEHQAQYLQMAEAEGSDPFAVALTRAELALAHSQLEQASEQLQEMRAQRPRHPRVLRLLARCYAESAQWQQLLTLIPDLRRSRAASETRIDDWEHSAALGALATAPDDAALEAHWRALGRRMRQRVDLVEAYAGRATQLERVDLAMAAIELSLKRDWHEALVIRYGELTPSDPIPQLRQAERWLRDHTESAALLLALGQLSRRAGLWGKAAEYLRAAIAAGGPAKAWEALGELYEHEQCMEAARQCYRNALKAGRGEATSPVPVPSSRADTEHEPSTEARTSAGIPLAPK